MSLCKIPFPLFRTSPLPPPPPLTCSTFYFIFPTLRTFFFPFFYLYKLSPNFSVPQEMSHMLAQKQLRSIILSVSRSPAPPLSSLYLAVVPLIPPPVPGFDLCSLILLLPSQILLFFIISPFKRPPPRPSTPRPRPASVSSCRT